MTTPAGQAETAAEAIRALNHTTLPGADGLVWPSDVCDVLGHLETLAARLPQALSQLETWLDAETENGRVVIVEGEHAGDPAAAAATVGHWTDTATEAAGVLQHALEQAHAALTWAAGTHCR